MKKSKKILLIAGSLVILGCIVLVCVMCALRWDFKKLSTAEYETNTTEIEETFDGISISTQTSDIFFVPSDDGSCKVECYEDKKATHAVNVENGTLFVKINNKKSWYDYIGVQFDSPKITVYLPKTDFNGLSVDGSTGNVTVPKDCSFESADVSLTTGNVDFRAAVSGALKIKTNTGSIGVYGTSVGSADLSVTTGTVNVSGLTCDGNVTVSVSTGKANLKDIACDSLTSNGSTGDIVLNNVIAENQISVKRSTGDVKFDGCDAAEIDVNTSTGDVTGSLLTEKTFVTETSTGKIDVPSTAAGGVCRIKTSTGNIKITLA